MFGGLAALCKRMIARARALIVMSLASRLRDGTVSG